MRYFYVNYLNVIGFGISNVRYVVGNIIYEFCIVIYCLDKLIILYGENFLLESFKEFFCDVREDVILFGFCYDCYYVNVSLGCSIGMFFKSDFGFVGFFVKLNLVLNKYVIGFFIVVYVVI